ncbi:MAG: mechanosensitive ion channel family protein [Chloroflexi bacterium]|nr:mechanosensitive ion channel family protein [Chloroflexota bacterium]MBL7061614.1 mechanosensitive ion channel family protein [Dehalococcoidia bacterium]
MDWTPFVTWLIEHGTRILLIIAVAVALYYILRHFVPIMVKKTVSRTMVGKGKTAIKKRNTTLSNIFIETGMVFVGVVAIFMIISELGINIAPALAGLGIAGIAVGFGAQSLVKDLFNGVLILLEDHYGVGDYVHIAGIDGLVEDVTLRRTVLRDLDGTVHSIPNGEIGVASNYTKEWSRVNLNISVGYGEDLDRVIEVINRVGKEMAEDPDWAPRILKAPQALRVDNLGDSGIDIKIVGETKPLAQWEVMGELRLRLKKVFDKEGIEIPWPHTKVFFGDAAETGIKGLIEQKAPADAKAEHQSKRKRHRKLPPNQD